MKIIILILSLFLSFTFMGKFSSNEKVYASESTPIVLDTLEFTETGCNAKYGGNPVTIDGISFDANTLTYTITNINLEVNLTSNSSKVRYENQQPGESYVMNFIISGDNLITYKGESTGRMTGLTFYQGCKYIFTGNGSFTVDSKLVAISTESNDFVSSGIDNSGTLEIHEGVTFKGIGGNGAKGSYGIYNSGYLYNLGGTITGVSGTSNPSSFKHYKNGSGIGFYNSFVFDMEQYRFVGYYEQSGETSVLNGIGEVNSMESYGIYLDAEGDGLSTFKVSGGTVNAISKGCFDLDNTTSVGLHVTREVKFNCENCVINCETQCMRPNPIDTEEGNYLDPHYVAFETDFNEEYLNLGNNLFIKCKSTNVDRSLVAWFEDSVADLYCIPEGEQLIFGHNCLECEYPTEVQFEKTFNVMEETEEGQIEIMANHVYTPTDLEVVFVGKNAYYNTNKENAKNSINNSIDGSKGEEKSLADEYIGKINAVQYDSINLQSAVDTINNLKAEFDSKLAELRSHKGSPVGLIIVITVAVLVVVYGVGFVLWKKQSISFLTKAFFNKAYGWLDKLFTKKQN